MLNKGFKFYNKKVLVVGLGSTGKSIIKFLESKKCKILFWDDEVKRKTFLAAKRIENRNFNIDFFDYIFTSPGVSKKHFLIKKALKQNINIYTDIDLFLYIIDFLNLKNNLICITGTNGKSTVAQIIASFLKIKPLANFGNSVLNNIPSESKNLVLELSSFQLDYISFIKPKIAIITNIKKDHINHHGTYKNYRNSKVKISTFQNGKDYLILNYDDPNIRKIFYKTLKVKAKIIWVSEKHTIDNGITINKNLILDNYFEKKEIIFTNSSFLDLPHNRLNIVLSFAALKALNYEVDQIITSLRKFRGLPHRLELIGRINNTKFYNDSKATNVAATCSALDSFEKVILIAGGSNKGESFNNLRKYVNKIQAAYLYGETAENISLSLKFLQINIICKNLKDAMYKAFAFSQKSNSFYPILLSPASASFDFYENYKKRGRHFKKIFKEIKNGVAC